MGSNNGDDEKPVHTVHIREPFWLSKTEVTQKQYRQVMGRNPSFFKGDNNPVEKVSWNDAVKFCKKLTQREHASGRLPSEYEYTLPSEAQWEYACRAGTKTKYYWGNDFGEGHCNAENDVGSSEDKQVAYFKRKGWSTDSTMTVGKFAPNQWGVYDMSGNVWEWCMDNWRDFKNAENGRSYTLHG